MRDQGMTNTALARRMLDLRDANKIGRLEIALATLSMKLTIGVSAA